MRLTIPPVSISTPQGFQLPIDAQPTRLKDIKQLIADRAHVEWNLTTVTVTLPRFMWRQVTIEEVALIVLGHKDVRDCTVDTSSDNRAVHVEFKHSDRQNNKIRNIPDDCGDLD